MHAPPLRLMKALSVLLLAGQGLGWCQNTTYFSSVPQPSVTTGVALAKANDAMFSLQSKDSLFIGPALAVNAVHEQFQLDHISNTLALKMLNAARDRTDRVFRQRADRFSPWKGREGDAWVCDVRDAIQLLDLAAQKFR
jgi:hypothetical protein